MLPLAVGHHNADDHAVPISLVRDEQRHWLIARANGSLSIEEVLDFIRTTRADVAMRMWPLLFDARSCRTSMTTDDVEQAVAIVRAVARNEQRGHVAIVADDDLVFQRFLLYETRCHDAGVRVIRVFRQHLDAVTWLEIMSAGRGYGGTS